MFWSITLQICSFFFKIFLLIFVLLAIAVTPFLLSVLFQFCKQYRSGSRFKKSTVKRAVIKKSIFTRLFIDFPARIVADRFNRHPDEFREHGIVCFVGEQGSGKSISVVNYINVMKQKYPLVHVLSNTPCDFADKLISDPSDFIHQNNGIYGTLVFLDETQNWFNSLESRNFPPEALSDLCMERKQHKQLLLTTPRFELLAAPIRRQCSLFVCPFTVAGCLTVVRVYKPRLGALKDDMTMSDLRKIKTYFFVHSDLERGAFDTFKTVEHISMKGWKPRSEQITAEPQLSDNN